MLVIDFWHWWILAIALLALEAMLPGAIFLWMGISAGILGLLVYLMPGWGWEAEVFAFALLSILTILSWRAYQRRHPPVSAQPLLNQRGRQYVGRSFTLAAPIVNGAGKIRVDDSTWKVRGEDCPEGSVVVVTDVDGVVLKVRRRA